jgi:hypothetical protein
MTRKGNSGGFKLQFEPAEIPVLLKLYKPNLDDPALAAGSRICKGECTRNNLSKIFKWKTKGRGRSRLLLNSDEEIADALHLAVSAKTERAALAVLLGLQGVDTPVASAILTAIDPERYTVIDFRALESLGSNSKNRSINFYLCYLDFCRNLAKIHQIKLRDLDRALWHWSAMQPAR